MRKVCEKSGRSEMGRWRSARNEKRGEARSFSSFMVQSGKYYFFGGAMTSFAALATRNLTTVLALILMASPVWGLRPMRALRSALTRRPMPGMTKTPFFLVSLIAVSASRSRKAADCLLVSSSFSARLPGKSGLGQSSCHVMFSFSRLLPGFPPLGIFLKRSRRPEPYRMEGVRPRQRLHETPVFMRVRTEPCRS